MRDSSLWQNHAYAPIPRAWRRTTAAMAKSRRPAPAEASPPASSPLPLCWGPTGRCGNSSIWHNHSPENGQYTHRHEGGDKRHVHEDSALWLCWWDDKGGAYR